MVDDSQRDGRCTGYDDLTGNGSTLTAFRALQL